MFGEKDELGQMRLQYLLKQAPAILPLLWRLMQSADGKLIYKLLCSKSDDGKALRSAFADAVAGCTDQQPVFHVMMQAMPSAMKDIIDLILMDHDQPKNLEALLRGLASSANDMTGWQLMTANMKADQKLQFLHVLSDHLNDFSTPDLILFGGELNRGLTDEQSLYRGLCNERHKMFRGHYGKTSIWQELIGKTQEILRQRKDAAKVKGVQEILQIKSGR